MRTKFKLLFVAGLFVFLCCVPTFAQDTVSPQKKALIQEFLEATGGKKAANEMIDLMMRAQEAETAKMMESMVDDDKNLSAAEKNELKKTMTESAERTSEHIRKFFAERLNFGEVMEEMMVPLYDKHFTESELRDLVTFYRSPTGQKMVASMPSLMMDTIGAVSEKIVPKLQEFMKEAAEAEMAILKEKVKPAVKKPVRKS
jgi:hypothetical protein